MNKYLMKSIYMRNFINKTKKHKQKEKIIIKGLLLYKQLQFVFMNLVISRQVLSLHSIEIK